MVTPNRFKVFLAGALIGSSWSIKAANDKLTAAVLIRAHERGSFPVDGHIFDGQGVQVEARHFPGFFDSEGTSHGL